jgi:hypothetical protein
MPYGPMDVKGSREKIFPSRFLSIPLTGLCSYGSAGLGVFGVFGVFHGVFGEAIWCVWGEVKTRW